MNPPSPGSLWRSTSPADRVALAVVALYALVHFARPAWTDSSPMGFVRLFVFVAAAYLSIRLLAWARRRLMWSLRNRLILAYVLIAVVPVVLLLAMAWLSAYLIYSQLGAHLFHTDLQNRLDRLADVAESAAVISMSAGSGSLSVRKGDDPLSTMLARVGAELPGIRVELGSGQDLLERRGAARAARFTGVVQSHDEVSLRAVVAVRNAIASASVPLTSELLDGIAPELGPIQLTVTQPAPEKNFSGVVLSVGERRFLTVKQIGTSRRTLAPPAHWLDTEVSWLSNLDAVAMGPTGPLEMPNPLFFSFSARPSQLNRRLLTSLGQFRDFVSLALIVTGLMFLVIEIAALRVGVAMTRSITHAVDDLSRATQQVQVGDFNARVRIHQRDQLGALGESFNTMTASISELIEEQRTRQKLENELSIAREVQSQLFPQSLPAMPGLELAAICRAARVVSGDYYDFIRLGPSQLGIALADISGKGISAALLMASLQAALRSQLVLDGSALQSACGLVSRLNRHLYLNTSDDRYATFFYAVYDVEKHLLRFTNAGHLPPLCIIGETVRKLEDGGTVIGLFDDCKYDEGVVQIEPDSLFVAYSDGLIEPENVYGEQFGIRRLVEEVRRRRSAAPQQIAEELVAAVEQWSGTPEQADDMTVIVVRMG